MNILFASMSHESIQKICIRLKRYNITKSNISNIYSNTPCNSCFLANIEVTFIENMNVKTFIKEKQINMVITNQIHNYMLDNNSLCIASLYKQTNATKHIYWYKDIPSLINTFNLQTIHQNKTNCAKELYRNICLRYLNNFKKITIPELQLHLNNEAVLVEYRILPHIEVLLRNMIYNLGDSWSYSIVCGNNNISYVTQMCNNISNNIKIIQTNHDNITQNEYNNMLLTTEFWDLFYGKKILIYQEDTCIFHKDINPYLEFDYVGGAFAFDCVTPINVGNGGFSLRSKSIMKQIIENTPPKKFTSNCKSSLRYKNTVKLDLFPEDVYFPQLMQNLNIGKVAPYNICKNFSSEQIFTQNSLGMHCLWFSNKNWEQYIIRYFNNLFDNIIEVNNVNKKINVYFIHCDDFKDRDIKINKAQNQLLKEHGNNYNINIFKSINTTNHPLDLENQIKILKMQDINLNFDNPEKFIFYKGGQIGCYLAHHLIIKNIAENIQDSTDYSIVFEDDIDLKHNFTSSVLKIIEYFETNNETFDVIYLGSLNDNKGTKKHNNIYNLNKLFWNFGAHGLLINNKNAHKLYKFNCNILHEPDNQYKLLYNNDLINAYYIEPHLVFQDKKCINHINLEK